MQITTTYQERVGAFTKGERDIKKGFRHHLQERTLIYVFIQNHEHKYRVEMMCRVLQLSRSSYYQWKKNPIGKRKLRSNELDKRIRSAYDQALGRYGSPRLAKPEPRYHVKL